jgi:hypothetical protein
LFAKLGLKLHVFWHAFSSNAQSNPMQKIVRFSMLFGLLLVWLFLQVACTTVTETHTLTLKGVVLAAEGPLFSGSNTAQGIATPDLAGWLQSKKKSVQDVRDARLVRVVIQAQDAASMQAISSMSMSFASDMLDMQPVGVLNPVPEGVPSASVSVADKQKHTLAFLRQPVFMVLLDCDMPQDAEDDLTLTADLEFEILLKQ